MFVDSRSISKQTTLTTDLCIIGGGAAGITIALELIDSQTDVILLESGGFAPDAATQSLCEGENIGFSFDGPEHRSRYLGGCTNCWGGWCRPFDALDFEERPWIANSGWPFGLDELQPYYERSHRLLQIGPYEYGPERMNSTLKANNTALFPLESARVNSVVNKLSPPVRFGHRFRRELGAASRLRVLLYANATEIETERDSERARAVTVRTLTGVDFSIEAKVFVIAAGGIETPRLLLASRGRSDDGIGNGHDLVGRYFMNHPRLRTTSVRLPDQRRHRTLYDATVTAVRRRAVYPDLPEAAHVAPTEALQRERELPNARLYLLARYYDADSDSYAALKAVKQQFVERRRYAVPVAKMAREISRNLPAILRRAPHAALTLADNRLNPSFVTRDFDLEMVFEPVPNPDSRVTLTEDRDQLGMNRVCVDWRLTDLDRENFLQMHEIMHDELEQAGVVVASKDRADPSTLWPDKVEGCWHHMGTTRMDADPRKGVVDADCRVHGVPNLFIAGSSVFPTAGSDMPTMTIVALAMRLAQGLRSERLGR